MRERESMEVGPAASTEAGPPPPPGRAERLRHDLRWVTIAWVFGALWMWTITGAAVTRFAKGLGTPDWAFGILAALPFLATLSQLPAGYYLERRGHRKGVFMHLATAHRLTWVVLALIPWVVPEVGGLWWITMLLVLAANWAMGAATGPAWVSWMADVIPRKVRGRYFAVRNRIGQMVGLVATLGIGYVLDLADVAAHGPGGARAGLHITSAVLALAGVVGAIDIQCFRGIQDDYPLRTQPRGDFWEMLRRPLADANFRRYLAYTLVLYLAIGFVGQYVWLYAFDVIGMSSKQANLLIVAIPLVLMMSSYPLWGRLMDRVGRKPVLIIGGTMVIFGASGWVFMGPDVAGDIDWSGIGSWAGLTRVVGEVLGAEWNWHSRIGYLSIVVAIMGWPGVELANFNVVLDMSNPQPGQRGGAGYVALNSVAIALGGLASGLIAGGVAGWLKGWQQAIPGTNLLLTYHGVLFLGSTLVRVAAVLLVLRVHEPRAVGTRTALAFMSQTIYSNVRETFTLPIRLAGRVTTWTFLLSLPLARRIRFGQR